jgi:hypothetical protein
MTHTDRRRLLNFATDLNWILGDKKQKNAVFISYSHKDAQWLTDLKRHLGGFKSKINLWDDTRISTGTPWKKEITQAISDARVAILILSADFFNSDFITTEELPKILSEAENEGTVVMSVVLKPCLVHEYPEIMLYQFINSPDKTIIEMAESEKEHTWLKLAMEVKKYVS